MKCWPKCRKKCLLFCFPKLLSNELYWWRIRNKQRKHRKRKSSHCWEVLVSHPRSQLAGLIAGLCLVSLGPGPSGLWLHGWGLLAPCFLDASLCPSRHLHKTLSLWSSFQVGLCVAKCILVGFQMFFFSRIPGFSGPLWGMLYRSRKGTGEEESSASSLYTNPATSEATLL